MRPPHVARLVGALGLVWLVPMPALLAATRVELSIDEPRPNRTVAWPVTTGVPFPRGGLSNIAHCRLLDDRGTEQPLQAKAAAWWDKELSSIRWLTIDFIAQPECKYALEFGPDVVPKPAATPLGVNAETLIINTGALQAEFSRRGPSALGAIRIDLNGNGQIEPEETIAKGPAGGDHAYVDQNDNRADSNGDGEQREIIVESSGPIRACVRVDGWYTGPKGARIVRYRTRYHLFAGLQTVKIVDEFRIVGSTTDTQFRHVSLPLEIKLATDERRISFATPGLKEPVGTVDWTPETNTVNSKQVVYRHLGNADSMGMVERSKSLARGIDAETLHTCEHVGPWIQVSDGRAVVTGSLRWLWQQFPKQWIVADDYLTLQLWTGRTALDFSERGLREFLGPAGEKYLLNWKGVREPQTPIEGFFYFAGRHALERDGADGLGINKHHEIWYHFGRANEAAAGIEYGRLADEQPLCLATGEWNCSTDVFGPLAPRPNNSPYEAAVDQIFGLERAAQDEFGDYGWSLFGAGPHYSYQWDPESKRHYADPRRFEYHTYQRETQLWWCYFRSGERKFLDWALPNENHWVDIAVSHVPTAYSTEWRGGRSENASLLWPAGDWSIDSPLHYVRHHDTGEAWLRSASQYWATYHRTLETTSLAYYLTGDERFNDVIEFWRQFWSPLAGVRSDSRDVPRLYREQLWFKATAPGEPTKSWAEMLRDYAPFQSGSRHQLTLFFNLATMYEHTWDPVVRQVLDDYAAAFLDPKHPTGVWRCQDHEMPTRSDSPMLCHYWSPALWKYARATNDPRMPEILKRYFMAGYHADPFAEDVGVYSNVQIGWAWYFTHDPRHLAPALHELERLLPNALPLSEPGELGPRIYNPHHPVQVFTAVPRLVAALDDARRQGFEPAPPPLAPQRTLIALRSLAGEQVQATLWGWDAEPKLTDAAGAPVGTVIEHETHKSHRMPFDRVPRKYQVHRTRLTIPARPQASWYFVDPQLELGVPESAGVNALVCWAGAPVQVDPASRLWWRVPAGLRELTVETAQPNLLRFMKEDRELSVEKAGNLLIVSLDGIAGGSIAIENNATVPAWFRFKNVADRQCWVSPRGGDYPSPSSFPAGWERPAGAAAIVDSTVPIFIPGKFGTSLLVVPGKELQIPDESKDAQGVSHRLSDQRQGTIEFWIRRQWDDRIKPVRAFELLQNGPIQVLSSARLPLDEWAHVAVVWRPASENKPARTLVHVYVNGLDAAYYRSLDWEGYPKPRTFAATRPWLGKFLLRAAPGTSYAIDDLRISAVPRYVDSAVKLGREQTFNPYVFEPPNGPVGTDEATLIYLPLDGNLQSKAHAGQPMEATFNSKQK